MFYIAASDHMCDLSGEPCAKGERVCETCQDYEIVMGFVFDCPRHSRTTALKLEQRCCQQGLLQDTDELVDEMIFEPIRNSHNGKVRCRICGATGYPVDGGWRTTCSRGHSPCPKCGKMMPLTKKGKARKHGRCPVVPQPS